jgi:predicted Zn-dependent protease
VKIHKIFISFLPVIIFSLVILNCASGSGRRKEQAEARDSLIRELEFGRLLSEKIIQKYPVLNNEQSALYVNKVGKSVALFAGRSDIEYHFAILDSETINAFAAPGGYVFITKGALLKMKDEAELAAVLAHEIGHINNKHILKELPPPRETGGLVNTLAALLVAQGTVVSSAFTEVVNQASVLLFSKGYKKEDEYEADKSAIYYVAETGYTPRGLFDFVKRIKDIQEKDGNAVVYNTHPSPDERLERIKKLIEKEKFDLKKPDAEDRFKSEIRRLKSGS